MTNTVSTVNLSSQALVDFRSAFPLHRLPIQQFDWTFYDSDSKLPALLLLHGGGGLAEALFPQIQALSLSFRVIAPNIPTQLKTMEQVIDGLATLLNALDVNKVHLVGISLGGHIAQIFVRKHYGRVNDVILSHTAIPTEKLATKTQMQYRMLQLYPSTIIRSISRRSVATAIADAPIQIAGVERQFWLDYFDEQYRSKIDKSHVVSRATISADYFQNFTFHSSDLNYWDGRMLIVESGQDELYDEGERGALISMYPRAWLHSFESYTHIATILAFRQSVDLIVDFLKGDAYERV